MLNNAFLPLIISSTESSELAGNEKVKIANVKKTYFKVIVVYLTILRLIYKLFNPTPALGNSVFIGQRVIAKLNHILLYLSILVITISGALKKLFNGEMLDLFFFDLEIRDNFDLAELFYEIHFFGNYTLIALILLHISAVIIHKILFKENLLKRIL